MYFFKITSSVVKVTVLLLMLSSCAMSNSSENFDSEEVSLWNKVITKNFFQSIIGSGELSTNLEGSKIVYIFVYQPPASDPDYILSVAVEVGPAGTLLDIPEYERSMLLTPLAERAKRFPNVGSRSQTTTPFFGPGGSSFGLVSTTKDERFDINVHIMQGGAKGEVATFDVLEVSTRLHQAYNSIIDK